MSNHMWDGFWFLANADAWNKLPPDLQAIVTKRVNEAALAMRADVAKLNDELAKTLAAKGMQISTPDTEPFREQLRKSGFYAEWRKKFGDQAWMLLEKYAGKLG
jgi:TRAP-type C4-dicarboxylate transport system substrate-binding protein